MISDMFYAVYQAAEIGLYLSVTLDSILALDSIENDWFVDYMTTHRFHVGEWKIWQLGGGWHIRY